MTVPVTLIAAVAENGVIGADNGMPWRLPSDFAHFKRSTLGRPLIMGRKTFESIGKALAGRTNLVVTRQAGYQPDGVLVISDFAAALDHAQSIAAAEGADAVMVGGGADIYRQAMPHADRLLISHVALAPEGDALFPPIDAAIWGEGEDVPVAPDPRDSASYRVKLYRRRSGRPR